MKTKKNWERNNGFVYFCDIHHDCVPLTCLNLYICLFMSWCFERDIYKVTLYM